MSGVRWQVQQQAAAIFLCLLFYSAEAALDVEDEAELEEKPGMLNKTSKQKITRPTRDTNEPKSTKQQLFFIGECFNSLLIVVVNGLGLRIMIQSGYTRLKHMYLLNLTTADLMVGLLVPMLSVLSNVFYWPMEFYACLLSKLVKTSLTKVSVLCCCCISVDRLLRIQFPTSNTMFQSQKCRRAVVIGVWVLSFVWGFTVPLLIHPPIAEFKKCSHRAVIAPEVSVYSSTYAFFFPILVVMFFVHVQIWRLFRQSSQRVGVFAGMLAVLHGDKQITTTPSSNVTDSTFATRHKDLEKRLIKSLALAFVVLFVTWMPMKILNVIELHNPDILFVHLGSDNYLSLLYPFLLLSHTNSLLNTIIYCMGDGDLRRKFLYQFLLLCTCGTSKKASASSLMITGTPMPTRLLEMTDVTTTSKTVFTWTKPDDINSVELRETQMQ